ncbi:MAG: RNA polymerase sigma-70 factor [Bacteroidota bacterium]
MTEAALIKGIRKGDTRAYGHLFTHYYEWLCNYILKLSGNPSMSEDVVQEVMLALWEKRAQLRITGSVKGYLFTCCRNQFLQQVRKEKRRIDLLDKIQWEVISAEYPEYQEESKPQSQSRLKVLLEKLPPKCKEIFIMNKLERKKYREIAEDLDISVKTVENHMSKALRIVRDTSELR